MRNFTYQQRNIDDVLLHSSQATYCKNVDLEKGNITFKNNFPLSNTYLQETKLYNREYKISDGTDGFDAGTIIYKADDGNWYRVGLTHKEELLATIYKGETTSNFTGLKRDFIAGDILFPNHECSGVYDFSSTTKTDHNKYPLRTALAFVVSLPLEEGTTATLDIDIPSDDEVIETTNTTASNVIKKTGVYKINGEILQCIDINTNSSGEYSYTFKRGMDSTLKTTHASGDTVSVYKYYHFPIVLGKEKNVALFNWYGRVFRDGAQIEHFTSPDDISKGFTYVFDDVPPSVFTTSKFIGKQYTTSDTILESDIDTVWDTFYDYNINLVGNVRSETSVYHYSITNIIFRPISYTHTYNSDDGKWKATTTLFAQGSGKQARVTRFYSKLPTFNNTTLQQCIDATYTTAYAFLVWNIDGYHIRNNPIKMHYEMKGELSKKEYVYLEHFPKIVNMNEMVNPDDVYCNDAAVTVSAKRHNFIPAVGWWHSFDEFNINEPTIYKGSTASGYYGLLMTGVENNGTKDIESGALCRLERIYVEEGAPYTLYFKIKIRNEAGDNLLTYPKYNFYFYSPSDANFRLKYTLTDTEIYADVTKQVTEADNSVWYMIEAEQTSITDALFIAPDSEPPNKAKYIIAHQEKIFYVDRDNDNIIYYSKTGEPEAYPVVDSQGYEYFFKLNNSVVGFAVVGEILNIFTRKGVYAVYGNDERDFVFKPIDTTAQCLTNSVREFKEMCIFAVEGEGFYMSNGSQIKLISNSLGILHDLTEIRFSGADRRWYVAATEANSGIDPNTGDILYTEYIGYAFDSYKNGWTDFNTTDFSATWKSKRFIFSYTQTKNGAITTNGDVWKKSGRLSIEYKGDVEINVYKNGMITQNKTLPHSDNRTYIQLWTDWRKFRDFKIEFILHNPDAVVYSWKLDDYTADGEGATATSSQ